MSSPSRLVEILRNKGALAPEWAPTVAAVDRARFVPDTFEVGDRTVSRSADEAEWRRMVYADLPLITQHNDGDATDGRVAFPTCATSMPSLMLAMAAIVRDGDAVLEIGTGTGYHSAWLAHRLGEDRITTIETDKALYDIARHNLRRAGFRPHTVCGDGLAGVPGRAPYDRTIATCTVRDIPYAWVAQSAQGGTILTPWGSSFHSYSFATLTVRDGRATGRFSGRPAFMWARQQRRSYGRIRDWYHGERGDLATTTIDPRILEEDHHARFAVGLRVRDAWPLLSPADDGSDEATYWLFDDARTSWATVEYVPGRDRYETEQHGPRRLWDEVAAAYRAWTDAGSPPRDRYGITVTADGQRVWLDDPPRS
ncbi:methyltransferase domain-containing protein [Streptomyces celluloflavus]|uniref:methyltransferase domain-containing protein n=1 Tax=Streptomyces celluloflavus TaxID=58344 RepID=UPI00368EBF49